MCLNDTLVGFIGYFWTADLFCLWRGDTNVYWTQCLLEQPLFGVFWSYCMSQLALNS